MPHAQRSDQQKLVDIMFEVGLTIATHECFKNKSHEQIAEWIAGQLRACGFDTTPAGSSWGVLK